MPNVKTDLEDFAKEIEAFFKKLIDRLDGDEDAITDAKIMKSDVHGLAGTDEPEEEEIAPNPSEAPAPSSAGASSTDSSETSDSGSTAESPPPKAA